MSKRTASKAEDDTVANVAEVVWGFITGRVNEFDMDYLAENMSEMDKVRHYEMLRRTDKAAAERFARVEKFFKIHATVRVDTTSDGDLQILDYGRFFYVTSRIYASLFRCNWENSSEDLLEKEFLAYLSGQFPYTPRSSPFTTPHVRLTDWTLDGGTIYRQMSPQ